MTRFFLSRPMSRLAGGLLFTGLALLATGCNPGATSSEDASPSNAPFFDYGTTDSRSAYDSLDESRLPSEQQVADILKSMGHSRFEFRGKRVLVDGDMVLHRADFLEDLPDETPVLAKKSHQWYRVGAPRTVDRSRPYTMWISPRVGGTWAEAVRYAAREWGNMAKIRFIEMPLASMAHMQVDWAFTDPGAVAWAEYPRMVNGQVVTGKKIGISYTLGNQSAAKARLFMLHEFGHLVGFAHTNSLEGTYISGTPFLADAKSFMNSHIGSNNTITEGDRKAIRKMYP